MDLHAADASEQEAEAVRLESLGARRVDWDSYPEDPDFIVLEDPEGNRFCIVDLSHEPALLGFEVVRSFAAVLRRTTQNPVIS